MPGSADRLKRAQTLGALVKNVAVTLVGGIALLMVLRELNVDVMPMLTGAGIAGVALGFGAQWLVRDLIAGFFLILEDQVRVGDSVIINGQGGGVEAINLRTTILRDVEGAVHVFPNGAITTLANRTRDYAYYLIDVNVDFQQDTDKVVDVLRADRRRTAGRSRRWGRTSWSRSKCSAWTASATDRSPSDRASRRCRSASGTSAARCGDACAIALHARPGIDLPPAGLHTDAVAAEGLSRDHCAQRQHDSPVLEAARTEVQNQPARQARRLQVVDGLRLLDRTDRSQRLHLHDNRLEADQIGAVVKRQRPFLVRQREQHLRAKRDAARLELHHQRGAIDRFEKTAPEFGVHGHRGADDRKRLRVAQRSLGRHGGEASHASCHRDGEANTLQFQWDQDRAAAGIADVFPGARCESCVLHSTPSSALSSGSPQIAQMTQMRAPVTTRPGDTGRGAAG